MEVGAVFESPLALAAVFLAAVAAADWLGRRPGFRTAGAALIAIGFGAVLANTNLVPSAADGGPFYDVVFGQVAPVAIFLMMLEANLRAFGKAGGPMLAAFLIGSLGTVLGVFAALAATPVQAVLGESAAPLSGMFAATYIGGSSNFNAVGLHYGITGQGVVYGGAVAVDNVMTVLWMAAVLAAPAVLSRTKLWPKGPAPGAAAAQEREHRDARPLPDTLGLVVPLALAVAALAVSTQLSALTKSAGFEVPSILILTTIALAIAQTPFADRMTQAKPLSLVGIYLFLAVVGASADLSAVGELGRTAAVLFAFVAVLIGVHAAVLLAAGIVLKLDPSQMAVASIANIGGATTASAVAEAHGRFDLVLPGILVGVLGNVIGTYVGFAVAAAVGA